MLVGAEAVIARISSSATGTTAVSPPIPKAKRGVTRGLGLAERALSDGVI